jgi:hypothetical protein
MRGLVVCFLLLVALAALAIAAASAQEQPSISVSPHEGPPGTAITVSGLGFAPGDTVYIGVFPVTGIPGGHGIAPLATATVDGEGEFYIAAVIPPAGFENWARVYREYEVMAYPSSSGNRTSETVEVAPKAIFALTPSVLPPSGVGAGVVEGEGARAWALAAIGLAAALSGAAAVVFVTTRRRG